MPHKHKNPNSAMGQQIIAGTLATATVNTGSKLMSKIVKHPAIVFGLGIVTGYFVYKYRKEIIYNTTKTIDAGKDFILQQKESLEDIIAEVKEDK